MIVEKNKLNILLSIKVGRTKANQRNYNLLKIHALLSFRSVFFCLLSPKVTGLLSASLVFFFKFLNLWNKSAVNMVTSFSFFLLFLISKPMKNSF